MKQSLGPIGEVDLLTAKEMREAMGHQFSMFTRDFYRGVDYLGFAGVANASTVTIGGPDSGYIWSVKLVSAQLSVAGTLSLYPGDATNVAPFATIPGVTNGTNIEAVGTFTSNAVLLKDQRNMTLFFSAGTILNWRIQVKQVPAEMQAKL